MHVLFAVSNACMAGMVQLRPLRSGQHSGGIQGHSMFRHELFLCVNKLKYTNIVSMDIKCWLLWLFTFSLACYSASPLWLSLLLLLLLLFPEQMTFSDTVIKRLTGSPTFMVPYHHTPDWVLVVAG